MKILILCTGNTCRSPMAEGIVNDIVKREHLENEIQVESMGFAANDGELPTANAVECMKEIGIDISGKRARRVLMEDLEQADMFYVMTDSHKNIISDAIPDDEDRVMCWMYRTRLEAGSKCTGNAGIRSKLILNTNSAIV